MLPRHLSTLLLATTVSTLPIFAAAQSSDVVPEISTVEQLAATDTVAETGELSSLEQLAKDSPSLAMRDSETGEADTMMMLSDVLFNFGSAELAPEAISTLQAVALELEGVAAIKISGHTDALGAPNANYTLGLQRAEAVKAWFQSEGFLTDTTVRAISKGETDPIAANISASGLDNPAGRAQNRRVEFQVVEDADALASSEQIAATDLHSPG